MAVLSWTWLTVFVATAVDGVPRQHVERSHQCAYQHLLTALPNIYQGLEEYPSSRFSPPEDLTMPWHFAGHLNSSHLGCHKIIRPSNSLFVTFQNIQTCSIQDVQKTSRNLGFAHPCTMGCRLHAKFYVLRPPPELRKLQGQDFERLGSNGLQRPTPWILLYWLDCIVWPICICI